MAPPVLLPTRRIGGTEVSAVGFGAMGFGGNADVKIYGNVVTQEAGLKFLDEVYESGCTFWDTADIYANSEVHIGEWFKRTGKRGDIFLATKFGINVASMAPGSTAKPVNGSPEYCHQQFTASLKKLQTDYVDLYYLHRPDSTTPIETTVSAMAELVKQGKVKHLGLSEVNGDTLRRAHAVHPIAAIQVEYSPFCLDIEDEKIEVLKAARELGVAVVAYSPLGRGMITGKIRSPDDLEADDFRRRLPRFSAKNFPKVNALTDGLKAVGEKIGATPSQVSLAWLLANGVEGSDVIPIPGTTKSKYLKENLAAMNVTLSPEQIAEVRALAKTADSIEGARYPGDTNLLYVDTPLPM